MRSEKRAWVIALVAALVLSPAQLGCGGSSDQEPVLTVSAASSLKKAFEGYARVSREQRVRFSFGGSDLLAAQIRQGVRPDVYAAADVRLAEALFGEGLVSEPVVFAGNRLVIATRRESSVRSLEDLERAGTALVMGARSAPVGAYTRAVLARLPAERRTRILANVRSEEPDVASVVGKLVQGAADAAFVYATDVFAAKDELRALDLPPALRPRIRYAAAVPVEAPHPREGAAFVRGLLRGAGARELEAAGFEPPMP